MAIERDRFHPDLYRLLTGIDPGAELPTVDMLPGRLVAAAHANLALCRGGWQENPQELTCGACGEAAIYDVGRILVSQQGRDGFDLCFLGYFRCRSCGSGGPWNSPDAGSFALGAVVAQVERTSFGTSPWPGGVGTVELFDGYRPRSGADAEEHLLKLLAEDPADAQNFVRLANVYLSGGRPDLAMAAAEHALGLVPDHFEALLLIGHVVYRLEPAEAAWHLHRAVRFARSYRGLPPAEMRKLLAAALRDLWRIHRDSDGEIPFFPGDEETTADGGAQDAWTRLEEQTLHLRVRGGDASAFLPLASFLLNPERSVPQEGSGDFLHSGYVPVRKAPVPGRNEPCPCGSGLKYKRCCGRGA